jgi:hypothetical protein
MYSVLCVLQSKTLVEQLFLFCDIFSQSDIANTFGHQVVRSFSKEKQGNIYTVYTRFRVALYFH